MGMNESKMSFRQQLWHVLAQTGRLVFFTLESQGAEVWDKCRHTNNLHLPLLLSSSSPKDRERGKKSAWTTTNSSFLEWSSFPPSLKWYKKYINKKQKMKISIINYCDIFFLEFSFLSPKQQAHHDFWFLQFSNS